eukprot:m.982178 g.982178  ORF g.982178 m.982178 type:complete len:145 (+) comp23972_c0_seq69:1485-1919(+)
MQIVDEHHTLDLVAEVAARSAFGDDMLGIGAVLFFPTERTKFFTQTLVNVQGAKSVRRNGRDIHLFNKVLRHPYFQSLKWETFSPDVVYAGPLDDVHTATKMLIVHVADQKDKMELLVCVIISYLTLPNGTEPRSARSSEYGVL